MLFASRQYKKLNVLMTWIVSEIVLKLDPVSLNNFASFSAFIIFVLPIVGVYKQFFSVLHLRAVFWTVFCDSKYCFRNLQLFLTCSAFYYRSIKDDDVPTSWYQKLFHGRLFAPYITLKTLVDAPNIFAMNPFSKLFDGVIWFVTLMTLIYWKIRNGY